MKRLDVVNVRKEYPAPVIHLTMTDYLSAPTRHALPACEHLSNHHAVNLAHRIARALANTHRRRARYVRHFTDADRYWFAGYFAPAGSSAVSKVVRFDRIP